MSRFPCVCNGCCIDVAGLVVIVVDIVVGVVVVVVVAAAAVVVAVVVDLFCSPSVELLNVASLPFLLCAFASVGI